MGVRELDTWYSHQWNLQLLIIKTKLKFTIHSYTINGHSDFKVLYCVNNPSLEIHISSICQTLRYWLHKLSPTWFCIFLGGHKYNSKYGTSTNNHVQSHQGMTIKSSILKPVLRSPVSRPGSWPGPSATTVGLPPQQPLGQASQVASTGCLTGSKLPSPPTGAWWLTQR